MRVSAGESDSEKAEERERGTDSGFLLRMHSIVVSLCVEGENPMEAF